MSRYYKEPNKGKVPSVTTILDVMAKPYLVPWAAKVEREMCAEVMWTAYQGLRHFENRDEIFKYLSETSQAYKSVSKAALDIGSLVHGMVDAYWKLWGSIGLYEEEIYSLSPEESYMMFLSDYYPAESIKMLGAYFRCLKENNLTIRQTEQTVYGDDYAGTLDMTAWVCKTLCVGDLKTGDPDRIGPPCKPKLEHRCQVEAYRRAVPHGHNILGEDLGVEPSGRFIIYLRKGKFAGQYCFWFEDYNEKNESDWGVFQACKTIFNAMEGK